MLHPPPTLRALGAARFAIFFTVIAWVLYLTHQVLRLVQVEVTIRGAAETAVYMLIVTTLTLSACAYLISRLGHLKRARAHERVPRAVIDTFFANQDDAPRLTVLVPSYREDERVIRQTLLSAALQEYPDMRIVLLIDDPPNPEDAEQLLLLQKARSLPGEIERTLQRAHRSHADALASFEAHMRDGYSVTPVVMEHLARRYDKASAFLEELVDGYQVYDHADEFMTTAVLGRLTEEFNEIADALRSAIDDGAAISLQRMHQLYRRLVWTFQAKLVTFERKRYVSLSHATNKAMNLNSYLTMMGGRYRVQETSRGLLTHRVVTGPADLEVPDSDYVLTLDADSSLLPEYCLRLIHYMEQPDNKTTAVVQTPYCAYPRAATRIERIAGATTDLQHIAHQGLTHFGATSWVGANAVLRKAALDDIVEVEMRSGFAVKRYIQDRTVIEDTESTVDIIAHGWRLYNYPERLSYSATPPDFGALCVQRQRWANGGLVILPKLMKYLHRARSEKRRRPLEGLLRMNYLVSISWASVGLLLLLLYPFDTLLFSPLAALTALPYFVATATDLRRIGYKRRDMLRVYGFNLLLLPVNLSGVIKSLGQAIGGYKVDFARTPKVKSRTVAPLHFIILPMLFAAVSWYVLWVDVRNDRWMHAAFAGLNGMTVTYAVLAFIGPWNALVDAWMNLKTWVYRPVVNAAMETGSPDWATVLYHGSTHEASPAVAAQASTLALLDQAPDIRCDLERKAAKPAPVGPPVEADTGRRHQPREAIETLRRCLAELSGPEAAKVRQTLNEIEDSVLDLTGASASLIVRRERPAPSGYGA